MQERRSEPGYKGEVIKGRKLVFFTEVRSKLEYFGRWVHLSGKVLACSILLVLWLVS